MWRRYSKTTRLSWRGDLLEFSLFCRAHAQTTQGLRDPLPNRRRQIGHEGEKGIDRSKVSQIPEGGDRRFSDRAGSLLKLWQEDLQDEDLDVRVGIFQGFDKVIRDARIFRPREQFDRRRTDLSVGSL